MSRTVDLTFMEADFLLHAMSVWAIGEKGERYGESFDYADNDTVFLKSEEIDSLFNRIQDAKFDR